MFLEDGDLKSATSKGEVTVNSCEAGDDSRFNLRDRTHNEEKLVRAKQRAIIVELNETTQLDSR